MKGCVVVTTQGIIETVDPHGHGTGDLVTYIRQPFGGAGGGEVVTSYGYDVQDHLVQVTDGEGTVTEYRYSDRDLLTKETSEVSGVTDSTYTDSGELETKTDARGVVETRLYDALDRLTNIDYPDDSLDIAYTYGDPAVDFSIGRLTSIERDGHAVDYRYDRFGRIVQDGALTFEHDKNGNRIVLGYPGGAVATYTFDFADREATLTVDDGNGVQTVVSEASYLPSGPLDALALGNGFAETRTYDSRYYPDAIVLDDGVADVLSWDYATDAVGNPATILDLLDSSSDRTYAYQDYQYFLTQGDGPWGTLSWTYDTIGNRLSESRDGAVADIYTYVPNVAGGNSPQLDQIILGIGGVHDFSFDAAGNQTQADLAGNVIDRAYDDAGRMSRQERIAAEASTDFLYDGRSFLRRAEGRAPYPAGEAIFCDGFESGDESGWGAGDSTCLGTLTTEPVYSSEGLLHHNGETAVLYFAGRPVAQLAGNGLRYLTTDHLGTPIAMTAESVEWSGGFEPFGADYADASGAEVFLRFPGQWVDESWMTSSAGAGMLYNLHRWYLSALGAYFRPDPLGLEGGGNPYVYGLANPLAWVDPMGLKVELWCAPVGAGGDSQIRRVTGTLGGHCFVRVRCDSCSDSEGPYDLRLEVTGRTGGISNSRAEIPRDPPRFFVQGAFASVVPTAPSDFDSQDCKTEECIKNAYEFFAAVGFPYGAPPLGYLLGPNSNTFAATLLAVCGIGQVYWPRGIPPFTSPFSSGSTEF